MSESALECTEIHAGFIPLVDCAPFVVARELALDRQEGFRLHLHRETSWANIRDRLNLDHYHCAHMLAPMPIAATLGIAQAPIPMIAPMSLGLNGNAITVSTALYQQLNAITPDLASSGGMQGAKALAQLVKERTEGGRGVLTFGMVYPFSCHNYELRYWLASAGIHPDRDVRLTVLPPPLMVESLKAGHIDGCCVGAPWNSLAVDEGAGCILAHKNGIWSRSPEKVLGLKREWAARHPKSLEALVRALYRACKWLDEPGNRKEAAKLLAMPEYLDLSAETLAKPLTGRLQRDQAGSLLVDEDFQIFHRFNATLPRLEHAMWIIVQMLRWGHFSEPLNIADTARKVYRPDLHRQALRQTMSELPDFDMRFPRSEQALYFGEQPFDPHSPVAAFDSYDVHSSSLKSDQLKGVNKAP